MGRQENRVGCAKGFMVYVTPILSIQGLFQRLILYYHQQIKYILQLQISKPHKLSDNNQKLATYIFISGFTINFMNGLVRKQPPKPPSKLRLQGINRALLYPKKKIVSQYNQRTQSHHHFEIRQNQLNSKFMVRKRRLESICKQNKNIYIRINTQKSQYGRDDLNKSYRSSSAISKRMSRLRAMSRESSTSRLSRLSRDHSFTSKSKPVMRFKTPATKPVVCETLDVNKIDEKRVLDMKILFGVDKETQSTHNKENSNSTTKYKLPRIKERPGILTERNKFDIFHIKEEMEQKYPKIFKTIPVKSRQRSSHRKVPDIF